MDLGAKAVPDRTKNSHAPEMESSLISAPHAPFDYIVKFIKRLHWLLTVFHYEEVPKTECAKVPKK
jgi:hypothetical protein